MPKLRWAAAALAALAALYAAVTVPAALQNGECAASGLEQVDVFPGIGSHEASYLGITDLKMYDDGQPEMLTARRTVVELGVLCASSLARHARHYALWLVDCVQVSGCRSAPSFAFRRAATTSMYLQIGATGSALLRFREVELLKLVQGKPKGAFRNSSNNFAINSFQMSEPLAARTVRGAHSSHLLLIVSVIVTLRCFFWRKVKC